MLETLQQLDQQFLLYLNAMHSPFWDCFMGLFTAKLTWAPMYAAILYVVCRNFPPRIALLTVLAIVLTIVYADQICASIIRPFAERMRPSNPNNPIAEQVHLLNSRRGGRFGFPSCHAANSFGLAFFLVLLFRQKILSFFILSWAAINSYSRIYAGVHYPGDLLAGMLVGLSGALLLYFLYRQILRSPRIPFFSGQPEPHASITGPFRKAHYTNLIIYTGIFTIFVFILYSFFQTRL